MIILTASCGGDTTGDSPDSTAETDDDSGTTLQSTLSSIQENIFTPTCATSGCHSSSSASAGLSLAKGESFSELVGVASTQAPALNRVAAGDPDNSYLLDKLQGTQSAAGGSGSQMPQGGSPLSDDEIVVLTEWIENGAQNN